MPAADLELTVLMPCLNEAQTLAACIRKARACVERLGVAAEVLVADNGSTDDSRAIALREGARVIDVPVRGYGAALYHGARAARGMSRRLLKFSGGSGDGPYYATFSSARTSPSG